MPKPKTVQPLSPSPEEDLQQISMLEDQFIPNDYRNLVVARGNHNFIEGWVKPIKKYQDGFIPFQSAILQVNTQTKPNLSSYPSNQSSYKQRRSNSFSLPRENTARPQSSRFHIKKSNGKKWQSQQKTKRQLYLSEQFLPQNNNNDNTFTKYPSPQKNQKNSHHKKPSVQAVAFPLFQTPPVNTDRVAGKATAVGRIRRLMKVKMLRKQ